MRRFQFGKKCKFIMHTLPRVKVFICSDILTFNYSPLPTLRMLPEHDSFTEYLFAVTQFAYVTCFSVVLPITPLIVLINHLLNMRLDGFKICRGRRRPLSQKTGGIGVWNHVLHIVTVIAILTNCSLMALTSFQFSWLADQIGTLGVFALAIGWEHLMLLAKYIMQLSVSTMPADIQTEMRKKKYDQERKVYMALRAKKERRSGSVGVVEDRTSTRRNDSDDKGGEASENVSATFRTSPCPPIRESSAESCSHSSPDNQVEDNLVEVVSQKEEQLDEEPHGKKGGLVNVRATKRHSPLQEQYSVGPRRGSRQKPPSLRNQNSHLFSENNHPNFDEAVNKLPPQPHSTNRSPLEARECSLNDCRLNQSGKPSVSVQEGYGSKRKAEIGRSTQHEEVISPSSSLSTVPAMPTPCQLNLDSDDDDDDTPHTAADGNGYYPEATAPPLSPANQEYDKRTTLSSGSAYYEVMNDEDDHSGPKAKWSFPILQYARSERSLSLSDQHKKSR